MTEPNQSDADLTTSLAKLSRLSAARFSLKNLLTEVAAIAVQAVPGADGAGLTLLAIDRPNLLVDSDDFVTNIEDIQDRLGEGPAVRAAATGQTIRSGSIRSDARWPRFAIGIELLGVHSVLSLPLTIPTGVIGAMSLYAHAEQAFDARAERIGQAFAVPAAISAHNALILARARRLTVRLQSALTERRMIDQAIGILRSRTGGTAGEAMEQLQRTSQSQRIKLAAIAETIVEDAATRIPARGTDNWA